MSQKFGIKDAANLQFFHKAGTNKGKLFAYADYANVVANEWSADTVYAKAKGVNAIAWDHNKAGTVKFTFEVLDKKLLALLLGSDIDSASKAIHAHECLTPASGKVTLKVAPVEGTVQVFKHEDDGSIGEAITLGSSAISAKEITLSETGEVDVFYQKSVSVAETITVNANKFASNFEIIGDVEIKSPDGELHMAQIDWLNCKVQSNASLTFDAENVASVEMTFDILPDQGKGNDMATYSFYEDAE